MLENLQNYYQYADLVRNGKIVIDTKQINRSNWWYHYTGILNILKDGIETDYVRHLFITLDFGNGEIYDLNINDYYYNLMMWYYIVALDDEQLHPKHIIFKPAITKKVIKKFIDNKFIKNRKETYYNIILNNVIADELFYYIDIDNFSLYLSNTLNLEDSIELMQACPEYYNLLHLDLSNEPLDSVKNKGMEAVNRSKQIILNAEYYIGHEHCLKNPFASGEGISDKQYKDNSINIGTKPDGQGSIYHHSINTSYIMGGLNTVMNNFIDSASARVAQIISKKNVGDSGGFARIVGLNNSISYLHPDRDFDCGTNNYILQFIPNKNILNMLEGRHYRLQRFSPLQVISESDVHLIGKTILLRSPITCNSHAHGHGVCHICYGKRLARTNEDISIGRIASEIITSQYTQKRLSAKHLLESWIKVIFWTEEFYSKFNLNINTIELNKVNPDEFNGWTLQFKLDDVELENEENFYQFKYYSDGEHSTEDEVFYNEYLTKFEIVSPEGERFSIYGLVEDDDNSTNNAKLYISKAFKYIINSYIQTVDYMDSDDDTIIVNLRDLIDISIFKVKMENNDLGKSLDEFEALINKKEITKKFNVSELLYKLQNNVLNGGIKCKSIHLEVLLSNQIRSAEDRLKMPNWDNINEPYELLTLNEALTDNPSPIVSYLYRKLSRALNYSLTFDKYASSPFDLFFIRKPKKFINVDHEIIDIPDQSSIKPGECPVMYHHDYKEHDHAPRNTVEIVEKFRKEPKTTLD